MFTGIIEGLGIIKTITNDATNRHFTIEWEKSKELKIDQSIAHNGVCLTVVSCDAHTHTVTAINETLLKTNLNTWKVGDKVNLERCMVLHARIDGHIVQGHVDQTAVVSNIIDSNGSWYFSFEYDNTLGNVTVAKGSICINGVSLTVVDSGLNSFSVAIIPYTFEHTNFHELKIGDTVNLEFDIIGKYVQKILSSQSVQL
jgi:riboflavin synthase